MLNRAEMRLAKETKGPITPQMGLATTQTIRLGTTPVAAHPYLDEMAEMYRNGMSLATIGDKFGLTRERIRQILASGGVDRRPPGAYQRIQRLAWMKDNADAVENAWRRHRNIAAVIAEFTAQGIPATWVRAALDDKVHQGIAKPRPHANRRTDDELLAHIRAAANGNTTLGQVAYTDYRRSHPTAPTSLTLAHRFGSWNGAVEAAGLTPRSPNRKHYGRKWTIEDIRAWVKRFVEDCEAQGCRPSANRYEYWQRDHEDAPSLGLVRLRAGSWSGLLKEVL